MSETPRMHSEMCDFPVGCCTCGAAEYNNLLEKFIALRTDIAAKDAALSNALDWIRSNATKSVHELLHYYESALSPNPPVYVPGEIVEKLVEALEKCSQALFPFSKPATYSYLNPVIDKSKDALALARPFITKGEKS